MQKVMICAKSLVIHQMISPKLHGNSGRVSNVRSLKEFVLSMIMGTPSFMALAVFSIRQELVPKKLIICPQRLYAGDYATLKSCLNDAIGPRIAST